MINHLSVASVNPKKSAEGLAKLTVGSSTQFYPLDGAYVCFLSNREWSGCFVEFYPLGYKLTQGPSGVKFVHVDSSNYVNATHLNISLNKNHDEIAEAADELGLKHGPRGAMGIYDLWLEDQILIEIVNC
jgi:hypothetical protein